jgi:hypothetical protein
MSPFGDAFAPRCIILRELGAGGMGLVFLARDTSLDRLVAIKVLRPELATAAAIERFSREARILAGARRLAEACALTRRVLQHWEHADPGYADLVGVAQGLLKDCR